MEKGAMGLEDHDDLEPVAPFRFGFLFLAAHL